MNKKSLVLISLSLAVLFTACSGPVSPAETMQPPKNTQQQNSQQQSPPDKSIMDEFEQMKSKNSTPGELLKFIEPKIGNLEKADADKVVKALLEVQELQLENYNDKIMAEDFNLKINSYNMDDLLALKNIKHEDVKTLLQNAFNDGYKLSASEGMFYMEIDYVAMKNKFSQFVSEEVSEYLDIVAEEGSKHFADDAALRISFDQLAERVIKTEAFADKYKDNEFLKNVKEWHKNYFTAYLIGLNNTPAFNYEDNSIKPEVLESFKNSISKYPDSKLAGILKEYTVLIEKNGNKETQDVLNFVNKATGN